MRRALALVVLLVAAVACVPDTGPAPVEQQSGAEWATRYGQCLPIQTGYPEFCERPTPNVWPWTNVPTL